MSRLALPALLHELRRTSWVACIYGVLLCQPGLAAEGREPGDTSELHPATGTDVAELPRLLIIGDSISGGYTPPLRVLLQGEVNVHRIPANGGSTAKGVSQIEKWLGNEPWDIIHFNWGLHDIKGGRCQPAKYRKNLTRLVNRLEATGAKLIWASTTPVPPAKVTPTRRNKDVILINGVAAKIMEEHHIPVTDLYAVVLPRLKEMQQPANVHFTDAGSAFLAEQVATGIRDALLAERLALPETVNEPIPRERR